MLAGREGGAPARSRVPDQAIGSPPCSSEAWRNFEPDRRAGERDGELKDWSAWKFAKCVVAGMCGVDTLAGEPAAILDGVAERALETARDSGREWSGEAGLGVGTVESSG